MAVFRCKMCGGALEIGENASVATCEYCGTKQTLPRLNDETRANRYDRANHFRRNNEYDKASGIYEQILNEDPTDAEAYWSLVLCRYGVEYVEDPATHKRIPTVNRAQLTSVFDDGNYKSALQYADGYQKSIYEEEAKAINEIQKGILAISQKEEPFDVFICYKETDRDGRRTHDSVLANDLYHQLTQEGFKVFFSRITLEDKLGTAYEPYIFAALNSAKVMVVLGTKPEYFNAVWVKNEWSRYLALIKQGQKKMLIPAYKDMDPYDLPEEFSHLQAQDMSKLGFMQDLIRGIKKIAQPSAPTDPAVPATTAAPVANASVASFLKRAFLFLEDGDWTSANDYCEKVLDIDPENAQAYLGKLMAELKVKTQEDLKNCAKPFDGSHNYQKAVRFADENLKNFLAGTVEFIKTRNENTRLEGIYNEGKSILTSASTEKDYLKAAEMFMQIPTYKDASSLAEDCKKDAVLAAGQEKITTAEQKGLFSFDKAIAQYEDAIKTLQEISGWKNADKLAESSRKAIDTLKEKEEATRLERERQAELDRIAEQEHAKKVKKILAITVLCICIVVVLALLLNAVIIPAVRHSTNRKKLLNCNQGDTVIFGKYEQDGDTSNGKEEIEWQVLEVRDGKALLISKYALDSAPYCNKKNSDVTWETCTLRGWLNNEFLNSAFSEEERAMIPTVTVSADKNPESSTDPGNDTQDQVFLLSIDEAYEYFVSDNARKCSPTAQAIKNRCFEYSGNCWWWLRSPGCSQISAAYVSHGGYVSEHGNYVGIVDNGVRPALWMDLEA